MFAVKMLTDSVVTSNCYNNLNMFEHVFTFHIPLEVLYYNWSLLKAANVLMNYTKLCSVYVQFKRANQSCSPSKISQSINVEWCTCDRNGKQFF